MRISVILLARVQIDGRLIFELYTLNSKKSMIHHFKIALLFLGCAGENKHFRCR